ncbi:hydroxyacylglutathione hydrolase [Limimaricola soesokkakensis]|uniref:Hydroxyacylglutathione hydrolase n=1 Tax=Limimaricola soesokkakensis TaxID=1343159 RepID=A0A1X6Z8V6_9RHOB|nr:hydroxyacylglutathione hydrolase [Limimaricola soesokkakensis]PSK86712.1 hydroxyacylglutathione hydrolase [Limimaricola soesokkakensis]SLN42238.1 Hydroxyacylglutathione hydrolase [Limimaricola soesokkakensis]
MPLELLTVPCLSDNYAFLLHDAGTGRTALVDAPEAAPIRRALDAHGWRLSDILLTHHHDDHVAGVADLRDGARVIGARADAHRLPPLDLEVAPGDPLEVLGVKVEVIDVPGHTLGHVAFHFPQDHMAFTADSLMALGCGRLFEGTADQMWDSLRKLRDLPGQTLICSGHEYTETNARFALTIEPDNQALRDRAAAIARARAEGRPTVPSHLSEERATNPFLRADMPELQRAAGLEGHSAVQVFAEIRSRKDRF